MIYPLHSMGGLLLVAGSALAQETAGEPPPVRTDRTADQQVVINGRQSDIEANRDFVAGKLMIGRQQIEQSGLQSVTEILKREPVITAGKDGRISLLGLPGYTQILLDGRPPQGKSPLEMDLSQVDRIEIIKSATAETGPFGIAGTINIISRKIERKIQQQFNLGFTEIAGDYGGNGVWRINQFSPDNPWAFSLGLSARHAVTPGHGVDRQLLLSGLGTSQQLEQEQFQASRDTLRRDDFLTLTSEFAYQFAPGNTLSFKPDYGQITLDQRKTEQRNWVDGRGQQAWQRSTSPLSGMTLPLSWTYDGDDAGQIDTSLRWSRMTNRSDGLRLDLDTVNPNPASYTVRRQQYRDAQDSANWTFNYSNSFSGGHTFKTGLQWTYTRHDIERHYWLNDAVDSSLGVLSGNSSNLEQRRRIFVQDDWRLNKTLALNGGLAVEDQVFDIREEGIRNQPGFRVWSPSAHLVKKLEGSQKRQFRVSLARSFRAPDATQLMLQPSINPFAPCIPGGGCVSNSIDTADSMGNPALQPERALALNLSYEHGLSRDSQISFDAYARRITGKIGSELVIIEVPWSSQARYVQRPANLGQASIQGVSMNWRVASTDIWPAGPKVDMRGSLGWAHSVMEDLPAPDNHLEGQLPWRAKLGFSYAMGFMPVKIDLDANWMPSDWVRNSLTQRTYESRQRSLTASAIWSINPTVRMVLNADNLLAPEADSIREYLGAGSLVRSRSQNSSYTRIGLRLEMKI